MQVTRFAVISVLLLLTGCENQESSLVTMYQGAVVEGSGITSFVNYNDPTGTWAMEHCNALAKVYENEDSIHYVCSLTSFDKFKPRFR